MKYRTFKQNHSNVNIDIILTTLLPENQWPMFMGIIKSVYALSLEVALKFDALQRFIFSFRTFL
jgi:hypothetical protein